MKNKFKILFVLVFITLLSSAQNSSKEMIILKTWKIKNAKEYPAKTKFSFTENGKAKYFYLELSKNTIVLKDYVTKKAKEKYPFHIPVIPGKTCEEQEKEQMDYYKKNIYPGLLNTANQNCSPVRYCLQITCNGTPTLAIMYLITPTARKCRWFNATLKNEIKKYNFNLLAER